MREGIPHGTKRYVPGTPLNDTRYYSSGILLDNDYPHNPAEHVDTINSSSHAVTFFKSVNKKKDSFIIYKYIY